MTILEWVDMCVLEICGKLKPKVTKTLQQMKSYADASTAGTYLSIFLGVSLLFYLKIFFI